MCANSFSQQKLLGQASSARWRPPPGSTHLLAQPPARATDDHSNPVSPLRWDTIKITSAMGHSNCWTETIPQTSSSLVTWISMQRSLAIIKIMKENNGTGETSWDIASFHFFDFFHRYHKIIHLFSSTLFIKSFFHFHPPFFIFSISSIVIHFQSLSFTFMYTSSSTFIITPINFSESMLSNMTSIVPRESEYQNRSVRKNLTDKKSLLGSVSLA